MKNVLKAKAVEAVPVLASAMPAHPPKGMEYVLLKDGDWERTYLVPKPPSGTVNIVKGVPVLKDTPKTWHWDKKTNTITVEY